MRTIEFKHSGGPYGDATSRYEITFPDMIVADFIRIVLAEHPKDWGEIILNGEVICEYKRGKIITATKEINILTTTITTKDAHAHGGWTCMDYYIFGKVLKKVYPEPEEKPNFLF